MGMRAIVVFSLFASILLLGTSGIEQQSYALANEIPPTWDRAADCAVTYLFENFLNNVRDPPFDPGAQLAGGTCSAGNINTEPSLNDAFCEGAVNGAGVEAQVAEGLTCHVHVPNFDDPFNTKLLRVNVFWDGGIDPEIFKMKPSPSSSPECTFENRVIVNDGQHFYEDWICHPNPDNERIWMNVDGNTVFLQVFVDSISFGQAVGGDFIPLDSTMVLVAGAQYTAAWMIPVIVSGIGFAIVIARKF